MNLSGRFLIVLLAFWLGSFTLSGTMGAEAAEEVVKVRGANTMASLVNGWATLFNEASPSSRVVVSGGGTAAAFEALFEKACQLVMATRSINEKELQAAALGGAKPANAQICRECIAIITHPSNPVTALSLEHLRKIFEGEVTNWEEVGGPKETILVVTTDQTSGTALFLRKSVMEDGFFTGDARVRDFYTDIIRDVSRSKPLAVAYAGLLDASKAEQGKLVKILGIKKSPDSPSILPALESLRNGTYPLILPLYLYWDEASPPGSTRQFVEFCKKKCQSP